MAFLVIAGLIFVLSRTRRARRGSVVRRADVRLALFAVGLAALIAACSCFARDYEPCVECVVEGLLFFAVTLAMLGLAIAQLVALGHALEATYWQRRAGSAFVAPLDYGVGEDWIERQTANSPYRDAGIERIVSRGSPSTAARAIFDDVFLMAMATIAVTTSSALHRFPYPFFHACHGSSVQTTKLAIIQFRQSELTYRQVHPDACLSPIDLRRTGEIDSTTCLDDTWGRPITISCLENDEISVSSAGPDGKMGTADDVTVPPRNDD
jgi:hypothetical protein